MQLAWCLIYGLEIPQMIRIRNERLEIILWRMLPLQTTIRSRIHKRLRHFRRIQRVGPVSLSV